MQTIPPWRTPLPRGGGIAGLLLALITLELGIVLWMLEVEIWLLVWFYVGLAHGARWIWRNNPLGRTIDSVAAARERTTRAPYDPHGTPPERIDLGQLPHG